MEKLFNIIVHIHKDGITQVIGTQVEDSNIKPIDVANKYIEEKLNGKLPDGDQIAVRHLPVDMVVLDDPKWSCPKINEDADIILVG